MTANNSDPTIRFKMPHRSLTAFPDTVLPRLVVLTGVNGAGKTHFLQALGEGALEVEGITTKQIRYFDWTSMFEVSDERATRDEIRRQGTQAKDGIRAIRSRQESSLRAALAELGVDEREDPWAIVRARPELRAEQRVKTVFEAVMQEFYQHLGVLDVVQFQLGRANDGLAGDWFELAYLDAHDLASRSVSPRQKADLLDKSVRLLRDNPGWMPLEFVEVFQALLKHEP